MPPTDNSAVQITINVVDANSGEVVSRVTKNLTGMGSAGAGAGKALKTGLDSAGEAGTRSGQKVAAGMDKAGGHSLSALDNVRLLRDDLGIRIPRAMEVVISRSAGLSAAIGAIGTGLIAIGAAGIIIRLGEEVYQLYEKWLDTNKAVKEYREKAAEAAQQKLFDEGSFDSTMGFLKQAGAQLDALQAKKRNRENSSLLDNIFLPHSTAPRFTTDDDKHLAQAQEVNDRESLRSLAQSHELMLKNIDDHEKLSKASANSAGAIAVERRAALDRDRETRDYQRSVERTNAEIYNRAHARDPKKFPGTYTPSKNAGQQEFDASENNADLSQRASSTELAFQQQRDLMKLKQEADNQGLAGERLLQAQRVAAIEELNAKYKFQTQNNRQYALEEAEIHRRFDNEEQQRLDEQSRTLRKRVADEAAKGLTGIAAIDARTSASRGQVEEDLTQHKFYGNKDQQQQYATGLKGAIDQGAAAEVLQQLTRFNDQLAQMDAARSDRFESETGRIQSAADRSVTEIQKAWREAYGQLDVMDARRVQSFAAVQAEIVKIQQDAEKQKAEAGQRIENETERLERQAARTGQPKEHEETQAILDAYTDRYQQLEQLRQNDAANADKYRRQELAEEAIKNGKLVDLQRQMRDKLAGELQGLFTNPIEALKRQGEQIASRAAASYILKVAKPEPGSLGTGGKAGGGLFGGVLDGAFPGTGGGLFGVRPFNSSKSNGGFGPGPLTSTPTGAATVQATSATIHVTSATITGLGSVGGLRTASYTPGGSGGFPAAGDAGVFSGPLTDQPSSTPGASSLGLASSASSTAGASSLSAIGAYQNSQRGPGSAVTSAISGVSQFPSSVGNLNTLGKELGMKGDVSAKIPGLGGLSKLAGNAKVSGLAGGALGLFSAFEGSGGIGGAFQGALSGAKFGAELGGPLGAGIGLAAGAVLGFIGFGARQKAAKYDRETVKPTIANELRSFEAGSSDYQTVYDDFDKLSRDAKIQTRTFGSGAKGYYDDTIAPEIKAAQTRLTREQKAGRSQFGFSAAQFHEGGRIWGFGDMATTGNQGFIHAERDEFMVRQQPAMEHSTALQYINSGASHRDMASYYGAGAGSAPVEPQPADVNLHFHSADAKGARQLLMDNKHHLRAALNASYEENSGGYDVA